MTFDYAATAETAARLLSRFGAAATLLRQTAGAYDPATGTSTPTETSHVTTAAVFAYAQKHIDGTLILQGDRLAYCDPGVTPAQGDRMTWQAVEYNVVAVTPIAPAGTVVLYEVQLRG